MRVGIVGAGLAGALLAWRLRQASPRVVVDVFVPADGGVGDATGASGGLVRGFERSLEAGRLAADSLAELRGDPALRKAAAYREIGSVYLLPPGTDPTPSVALVEARLPGSVEVLAAGGRPGGYPLRGRPAGAVAVVERHAGYLSPAGLRAAVLARLAEGGTQIRPVPVTGVSAEPALRLADGTIARCDVVVLATGAWTPALLAASRLAAGGLRSKQIQYSVFPARLPGLSAFVDDLTDLYGRPAADGAVLLGLPCDRWDVDPAEVRPDPALVERVAAQARRTFGAAALGDRPIRTVASFDCYCDPPGLLLREVTPGAALHTFTGGSGGAAKTALAASRVAAGMLLSRGRTGPAPPAGRPAEAGR